MPSRNEVDQEDDARAGGQVPGGMPDAVVENHRDTVCPVPLLRVYFELTVALGNIQSEMTAQERTRIAAVRLDAGTWTQAGEASGPVSRNMAGDQVGGEGTAGHVGRNGLAMGEAVQAEDLPAFAVELAFHPIYEFGLDTE